MANSTHADQDDWCVNEAVTYFFLLELARCSFQGSKATCVHDIKNIYNVKKYSSV